MNKLTLLVVLAAHDQQYSHGRDSYTDIRTHPYLSNKVHEKSFQENIDHP